MPLQAPGLENPTKLPLKTTCGGLSAGPLGAAGLTGGFKPLLDVAAQVEFAAREPDNSIESGLHFRGQIPSRNQPLGLAANGLERPHEVSLLELSGVVAGHGRALFIVENQHRRV